MDSFFYRFPYYATQTPVIHVTFSLYDVMIFLVVSDIFVIEQMNYTLNFQVMYKGQIKNDAASVEGLNDFMHKTRGQDALKALSKGRKIKEYQSKDVIFRENDYSNYLYLIVKGKVICTKTDAYGKDFVNDIHGEGDFIGYTALFEGSAYTETATALGTAYVVMIPKQDFINLINKNHDVATTFIKMLSGNIQDKEKRLLQLAYASVRERLATELINLKRKGLMQNGFPECMKISRENLAGIVGTATESLIRTLSELKKDGLVSTDGQEIKILDEIRLQKVAFGFR